MHNPRRTIRILIGVLLGVILVGYILFQSKNLIEGPKLTVTDPQNGEVFSAPLITVDGTARNIRSITLDDNPIFIDNNGHFSEQLLLPRGYSIIKLEVEDRFGKKREQFIHVFDSETTSLKALTSTSSIESATSAAASSTPNH